MLSLIITENYLLKEMQIKESRIKYKQEQAVLGTIDDN